VYIESWALSIFISTLLVRYVGEVAPTEEITNKVLLYFKGLYENLAPTSVVFN